MFCPYCEQVVEAPENRSDGAVRCPRCLKLTRLPERSARLKSSLVSVPVGQVGLGWFGYALVALVVAATAVVFALFRGHVQQRVLTWALPKPQSDAIHLVQFYCTNALPVGTNSPPLALGPRHRQRGSTYLVVQVSVESTSAGIQRLTDSQLQEVRRASPDFAMTEAWVSWPIKGWFKIVGPRHPLRPACAHLERPGVFAVASAWNSPPAPSKPARIEFTVCFVADRTLVEAGALSFQFRWNRPLPLRWIQRLSQTRSRAAQCLASGKANPSLWHCPGDLKPGAPASLPAHELQNTLLAGNDAGAPSGV